MNTALLSPIELKEASFKQLFEASKERISLEMVKGLERIGRSGLFHARFYLKKSHDSAAFLSGNFLNTVINTINSSEHQQSLTLKHIKDAWNAVYAPTTVNAPIIAASSLAILPAQGLNIGKEFASAQLEQAINFQVNCAFDQVESRIDGSFIGPETADMAQLRSAFSSGAVPPETFRQQSLLHHGLAFNQAGEVSISTDLNEALRSAFSGGLGDIEIRVHTPIAASSLNQSFAERVLGRISSTFSPLLSPAPQPALVPVRYNH